MGSQDSPVGEHIVDYSNATPRVFLSGQSLVTLASDYAIPALGTAARRRARRARALARARGRRRSGKDDLS